MKTLQDLIAATQAADDAEMLGPGFFRGDYLNIVDLTADDFEELAEVDDVWHAGAVMAHLLGASNVNQVIFIESETEEGDFSAAAECFVGDETLEAGIYGYSFIERGIFKGKNAVYLNDHGYSAIAYLA